MKELNTYLEENAYPGRGILVGRSADGESIVTAYFIMGRSENSRNRVFEKTKDGVRIRIPEKRESTDPSLILYTPVRRVKDYMVISNGDQTDVIQEGLSDGKGMKKSLKKCSFEPDAPNYTPRISCVVHRRKGNFSYEMSIIKTDQGNPDSELRQFFQYKNPLPEHGHLIHTYECDGSPLHPFQGEPICVSISENIDKFADNLWLSLNSENKISLFVEFINIETGVSKAEFIINFSRSYEYFKPNCKY